MSQDLNIRVPLSVNMTIKSLTITEDAYDALKAMKHGDESFSKAILRMSKARKEHLTRFFGILSKEEAEVLSKNIKRRRQEVEKEDKERRRKFKRIWEHGSS